MTLDELAEKIPDYAKDLRLNLSSVLKQAELSDQQTWGLAIASAHAARNAALYDAILQESTGKISAQAVEAAKSAAAIMGMNNIYYRFQHLAENEQYSTIPARLRMNVIRTHGVDPQDFELWATAVSAVNGCGKCIVAHEKVLREKNVSQEVIVAAVRIASVFHAIAAVLDAERVQ